MTSVKLINHSSSTADWNDYEIYKTYHAGLGRIFGLCL